MLLLRNNVGWGGAQPFLSRLLLKAQLSQNLTTLLVSIFSTYSKLPYKPSMSWFLNLYMIFFKTSEL